MSNKFLTTLYVGLLFCNSITVSKAGKYMDAFEHEVQDNRSRRLICNVTRKTEVKTYTTYDNVRVKVGESHGPLGTTAHYEDREVPRQFDSVSYYYRCSHCGYDASPYTTGRDTSLSLSALPKVTINQNGNIRIMTIQGRSDFPLCNRPNLESDELKLIWQRAGLDRFNTGASTSMGCSLESWRYTFNKMRVAARALDIELGGGDTDIEYVIEIEKPQMVARPAPQFWCCAVQ